MIPTIVTALRAVSTPRFFETERGYQGEFLAELRAALPALGLPGDAIVEQEYQKTLPLHNINVRPDIIIHVPAAEGGDRTVGDFSVFELNYRAGPKAPVLPMRMLSDELPVPLIAHEPFSVSPSPPTSPSDIRVARPDLNCSNRAAEVLTAAITVPVIRGDRITPGGADMTFDDVEITR